MSIVEGFDEIVDNALRIRHIGKPPHYSHTRSALELSARPSGFDAAKMLRDAHQVLHHNRALASQLADRRVSEENWRWVPKPHISPHNSSLEKTLEKRIVCLVGGEWVNQVPTASGLWNGNADKLRNVDLAHRVEEGVYELIELKIESDNALKAAIEVVQYGLLYLLARESYPADRLSQGHLLQAYEIRLRVLAPEAFYDRMKMGWLSIDLDKALRDLSNEVQPGLTMNFAFDAFPRWFLWPCSDGDCLRALDERKLYW